MEGGYLPNVNDLSKTLLESHRVRLGLCRTGLEAVLLLEDGSLYLGCGFGSERTVVGEVVFTTSMVGYPESLTDPSYAGQILIITHPLVGNYGVASKTLKMSDVPLHFESHRIWVSGLIIHELSLKPSHWTCARSLDEWLRSENVPGMFRVDTRSLVKKIRERGVMMGVLKVYDPDREPLTVDEVHRLADLLRQTPRYDNIPFVYEVAPAEKIVHEPETKPRLTIAILDCGVKLGIVRELLKRGCRVIRYPPTCSLNEILSECDGVLLSNGPGNPAILTEIVDEVREIIVDARVPTLGICLGHQLSALALGARTYKLRYGHRGSNKPVKDLESGKCYITTQNHGFAVDDKSAKEVGFKIWFVNIDDKSVEGLKHEKYPLITVQFHPEASPGPHDTCWIFDLFLRLVEKHRTR